MARTAKNPGPKSASKSKPPSQTTPEASGGGGDGTALTPAELAAKKQRRAERKKREKKLAKRTLNQFPTRQVQPVIPFLVPLVVINISFGQLK